MKYTAKSQFEHGHLSRLGILLTNLGTPDAPTRGALRRYLKEFLSDPRVVEFPRPLWWLVLNGIILNTRPQRSAKAYAKIWSEEGSPLLAYSRAQAKALQDHLDLACNGPVQVALGMRYGAPSIASALEELQAAGVWRLIVLPLYPQYSGSTTGSSFDAVFEILKSWRWVPEVRLINHYHDDPAYIAAMATHIRAHWARSGRGKHILFSFHGLPKRYLLAGDPYYCQCQKTARLLADALRLREDEWTVGFQSRFGRQEWLKPYVDKLLQSWPGQGRREIDVFCPGFAADCLETLEEIALQDRDIFMAAGGQRYEYIPALNADPAHIDALTTLILRHAAGWPETDPSWDREAALQAAYQCEERAKASGAK